MNPYSETLISTVRRHYADDADFDQQIDTMRFLSDDQHEDNEAIVAGGTALRWLIAGDPRWNIVEDIFDKYTEIQNTLEPQDGDE